MYRCRFLCKNGQKVLTIDIPARSKNGAIALLRQRLGYLPQQIRIVRIAA